MKPTLVLFSLMTLLAADTLRAQYLTPHDVDRLPSKPADARISYAPADALQFGDLRLPGGKGPFPLAIVVHGGCWTSSFATLQNTAAMADALRDAGVATWNIEYRRVDHEGGGWPGTFSDVADAADYVATLAASHPIDLTRVVAVGHSAGAHLALWLAARTRLPADSPLHRGSPLFVRGVIAIGGPGDLADFATYAQDICRAPVIEQLLGGSPAEVPERYAHASPAALLPLGTRQILIVGADDRVMPARARDAYVAAVEEAGDAVELIVVPQSGHFEAIAPGTQAWRVVEDRVLELVDLERSSITARDQSADRIVAKAADQETRSRTRCPR